MGYFDYTRLDTVNGLRLKYYEDVNLAGCNNGIICKHLTHLLRKDINPPFGWHISIGKALREQKEFGNDGHTLIVDIKPNSETEMVLCEITDIFGFSYAEWTPIMLRMKELQNDFCNDEFDDCNFLYPTETQIVYTMFYLKGSVENGEIVGTWNFSGRSTINAVLLYSEALTFFFQKIKEHDPEMINEIIKILG